MRVRCFIDNTLPWANPLGTAGFADAMQKRRILWNHQGEDFDLTFMDGTLAQVADVDGPLAVFDRRDHCVLDETSRKEYLDPRVLRVYQPGVGIPTGMGPNEVAQLSYGGAQYLRQTQSLEWLPKVAYHSDLPPKIRPLTTLPWDGWPFNDYLLKEEWAGSRDIDVIYSGRVKGLWHHWSPDHRLRGARLLQQHFGGELSLLINLTAKAFSRERHFHFLTKSKVCVSPWGNSEVSLKDWEAIAAGCVLVKPWCGSAGLAPLAAHQERGVVLCKPGWGNLKEAVQAALARSSEDREERDSIARAMAGSMVSVDLLAEYLANDLKTIKLGAAEA
jgi:hypothetical protein